MGGGVHLGNTLLVGRAPLLGELLRNGVGTEEFLRAQVLLPGKGQRNTRAGSLLQPLASKAAMMIVVTLTEGARTGLFVVPALPDFTARFPEIHLDIGCSERVVDLVQEGVDCAIRGGVVADQDLVCRTIGQMRLCFCASPTYLASAEPIHTPADLPRHKHLGFKFPATDRRYVPPLTHGTEHFTLDHPPSMYFNNGSATAAAAVAGLGVAFLPRAEAEPHFRSGALVEVLPHWQMASMPLSIVYPYTRHLSAGVRAFADWVTALMASDPLWSQLEKA